MIDQSTSTCGRLRSRAFHTRPRRPPGRRTRAASASATGASNQWNAWATAIASVHPSANGSCSAAHDEDGHRRAAVVQDGAHAVDRFGGDEVGAEWLEETGQLAGPGREVEDPPAGRDPQVLHEPTDAVGRVARPGPVVGDRLAVEPRIGDAVDRHRAMMAGVTAGESISFDKVAAIYDATRGGLERGIRFAAAIEPFCGPGPVFEIGIGTGAIAKPLRDRIGRTVLGADLSAEMLAHAHRRLGPAVVRSDVARLPVRDGALGTVVACWVLHLVGDAPATLREVRRVLGRDGRLVVISSRGELEPDDLDRAMVDLHDVLRGRVDIRERLVPIATDAGLTLVADVLTDPGTWSEAPADLIERLERRQWGALIDLDEARFARHVQPVIDRLRALPDPSRPRTRIGRHRLFVFRLA